MCAFETTQILTRTLPQGAGSDELDTQKLPDLLELKFGSVSDAKPAIGNIPEIRDMFIGMQSTL